jgi:hypothetical protein
VRLLSIEGWVQFASKNEFVTPLIVVPSKLIDVILLVVTLPLEVFAQG